ncbi:lecithin retinol acyltransferase-like [Paramacrobiotus metropolitanus]|uniref:lecithin retinol acyltransferase-like n=1 Tax=Paramacrobiotus metropolitanus TaxID=2943436 RepID=UPI00244583BC|nr:lecithin retinol acyltransferase-like [Paramacrobiotus metropolitanus]
MQRMIVTIDNFLSANPSFSENSWHKYDCTRLRNYRFADRIIISRGYYFHIALYMGDGRVVHFKPANREENGGLRNADKWFVGVAAIDSLENVAGDDYIRIGRFDREEAGVYIRPREDIKLLVEIFEKAPNIFNYCLERFNCEHFVNFLKYAAPVSCQVLFWHEINAQARSAGSTIRTTAERAVSTVGGIVGVVGLVPGTPDQERPDARNEERLVAMLERRSLLKTIPVSTSFADKRLELVDICVSIASELENHPRDEIENFFIW